jgi:hypothetical protein
MLVLASVVFVTLGCVLTQFVVRLANTFADLAQAEYRAELLDAIRSRPAAMLRLKLFLRKAPKERAHPLRYLVSYLNDQLKLNAITSN